MTRRAKTKETPLGRKLRMFAAGYATTGQQERADGLLQAADVVDQELALLELATADPLGAALERAGTLVERLEELVADGVAARRDAKASPFATTNEVPKPEVPRRMPSILQHGDRDAKPAKGERAVLTAIAQYRDGVTREQLTVLTGYRRSSRDTYLQRLRAAGFVEETDRIRATSAGFAELGPGFTPLPTGKALRDHWLQRLPEGERRILEVLLGAGRCLERDEVSEQTGYRRSSRDTYIQRLRARRLVEVSPQGVLYPSPALR